LEPWHELVQVRELEFQPPEGTSVAPFMWVAAFVVVLL
jgi:hypothetical protein